MKMLMKKNIRTLIYASISLVLLAGVLGLGIYIGYSRRPEVDKVISVSNKTAPFETTADFNTFWKVWNTINEKSIYANKVSDQDKIWGAIQGLAASVGDPYTVFFSPEENKLFKEEIKGSFSGIGAEIGVKDKILTVIAPLKDTPAWNAGMKSGDKIIKIDKVSTNNMTVDKAISLIRGEKGTNVILTILRPGEPETRELTITRGTINTPVVETEKREDGIFVIKFYSFSENSDMLFRDALLEFVKSDSQKLVVDLRGNPGGYLDVAVNIGSWFVDKGKIIVKEDAGTDGKSKIYRSHGPRIFNDKLKMMILVDGGSASASEILAGALREHGIAKLIGEKTYGKGSVQELVGITEDTSLKVTVANWLTPNGISISLQGLEPDIVVPFTLKDIEAKRDPQMDKAVELLLAK